jgi:hypothetical protein
LSRFEPLGKPSADAFCFCRGPAAGTMWVFAELAGHGARREDTAENDFSGASGTPPRIPLGIGKFLVGFEPLRPQS